MDKADKLNEREEPVEDEVEETTIMVVDAEGERSTIIHQEDLSLEDPFKQWGDMCSNYPKNQMIEHNTARLSTS